MKLIINRQLLVCSGSIATNIAALRKNGWVILSRRIVEVNGMGENRVVNEYWIKDKPTPREWDKQQVR